MSSHRVSLATSKRVQPTRKGLVAGQPDHHYVHTVFDEAQVKVPNSPPVENRVHGRKKRPGDDHRARSAPITIQEIFSNSINKVVRHTLTLPPSFPLLSIPTPLHPGL